MKRKILLLLLITAMFMSMCIVSGSAKEIDTLAEIAALSKLEPIGVYADTNAGYGLKGISSDSLPSSYSSRDLGYTTPVRQQSSNICWAYSSLSTFETILLKDGESVGHFSPQHMNIWGSVHEDGTGWQREDLYADGGYSYIPMGYFTSWTGPLYDYEFPIDWDRDEYNNMSSHSSAYGITGIKYINNQTPIDTIKSYVMEYGAVVTNFNADTANYMSARSEGFYCGDSTIPTSQLFGHSVSIVGWDDNYPKEIFSTSSSGDTPENNGAWLIKNSWGSYANDQGGYFWISYEDAWLFHSIFGPSFAISEYEKLDGSKEILQNEVDGATTQFSYITTERFHPANEITYINVFDFSEEYSVLDKVVFESTSYDADYTVYYIPILGGKPTQETFLWQKVGEGTIDYTGYISVDTNDFELPEGKGAIGISIDNTRTYKENSGKAGYKYIPNSIGVCEWLAYGGGYYFKNQGTAGDCYIMFSEYGITEYYELMDFYDQCFDDSMGGTFVIKAITENPDFTEDPTAPVVSIPDPTEDTPPTINTMTLNLKLQYLGNNMLTVIAEASGGSNNFVYEFMLDGEVLLNYSDKNYASLNLYEDGEYALQISAKDTESDKIIISHTTIIVKDGKIQSGCQNPEVSQPTDPEESATTQTETTEETTTAPQGVTRIVGDVDGSGEISIKDATLIRKHLAKIITFDNLTLAVSDVDVSGKCNITDATKIQKYIALIETDSLVGETAIFQAK